MKKKIINKKMLISSIVKMNPKLSVVLEEEYGFHCVGCLAAEAETLEEGALVHGIEGKELDKLIDRLNNY